MNLRQSRMASGGIKSRPTTPRPSAPGITVIGATPCTPNAIKIEKETVSISYQQDAFNQNRAARRKNKRKGR